MNFGTDLKDRWTCLLHNVLLKFHKIKFWNPNETYQVQPCLLDREYFSMIAVRRSRENFCNKLSWPAVWLVICREATERLRRWDIWKLGHRNLTWHRKEGENKMNRQMIDRRVKFNKFSHFFLVLPIWPCERSTYSRVPPLSESCRFCLSQWDLVFILITRWSVSFCDQV